MKNYFNRLSASTKEAYNFLAKEHEKSTTFVNMFAGIAYGHTMAWWLGLMPINPLFGASVLAATFLGSVIAPTKTTKIVAGTLSASISLPINLVTTFKIDDKKAPKTKSPKAV